MVEDTRPKQAIKEREEGENEEVNKEKENDENKTESGEKEDVNTPTTMISEEEGEIPAKHSISNVYITKLIKKENFRERKSFDNSQGINKPGNYNREIITN